MMPSMRTCVVGIAIAVSVGGSLAAAPQARGAVGTPGASRVNADPAAAPAPRPADRPVAELDVLMTFGAAAVALLLLCWGHESRFPRAVIGTAAAAVAAAVYGFAQGAWPLGIALAAFAAVKAGRWLAPHVGGGGHRQEGLRLGGPAPARPTADWKVESRVARLFGPS